VRSNAKGIVISREVARGLVALYAVESLCFIWSITILREEILVELPEKTERRS